MHSSDRTLLARLGFSDPDKGDNRHDLACQYFSANKKAALALVDHAYRIKYQSNYNGSNFKVETYAEPDKDECGPVVLEYPISKGEGQYKTTIGFVDVKIPFSKHVRIVGEQNINAWWPKEEPRWVHIDEVKVNNGDIYIEVKIHPVGLGDILRQVNLYKEYISGYNSIWFLVTPYAISRADCASLRVADVHHVRLGDEFKRWEVEQRERQGGGSAESDSFTI
jgi:hypothetical protein